MMVLPDALCSSCCDDYRSVHFVLVSRSITSYWHWHRSYLIVGICAVRNQGRKKPIINTHVLLFEELFVNLGTPLICFMGDLTLDWLIYVQQAAGELSLAQRFGNREKWATEPQRPQFNSGCGPSLTLPSLTLPSLTLPSLTLPSLSLSLSTCFLSASSQLIIQ